MHTKKWIISFLTLLVPLLFAPTVSAHVTLHPEESLTDAWEKYSVRVPVEKDMNTTEVELVVPEEVDLVNVMPKPGWDHKLEKDKDDIITSVTWIATDGGIGPNEFTEFYVVASNPSTPVDVSWDAYQTYEDDSVVEWDGDLDADKPAPVVEIAGGDAQAQHGDKGASTTDANAEEESEGDTSTSESHSSNWLPILLSSAAILLALISLFRKRA